MRLGLFAYFGGEIVASTFHTVTARTCWSVNSACSMPACCFISSASPWRASSRSSMMDAVPLPTID